MAIELDREQQRRAIRLHRAQVERFRALAARFPWLPSEVTRLSKLEAV